MENIPSKTNELNNQEGELSEQPTIFSDISVDNSAYEKNIRNARVWLYIIGGLQLLTGVYEYSKYPDYSDSIRWMIFGLDVFIGLVFLGLVILSYKKPVVAFTVSLVFYIVVNIWVLYSSGISALSFQLIIKVLVIIALIKAIKDAREFAALKKGLGTE